MVEVAVDLLVARTQHLPEFFSLLLSLRRVWPVNNRGKDKNGRESGKRVL